jgi:uncharacterized phage-associated protein
MNNKLRSIVYYLISKIPNLNKTEIVKLSYLADYNYYKYFNKDITGITYKYHHHGPFSKTVYDCIDSLEEKNIIKQNKYTSIIKEREYFSFEIINKFDIGEYLDNQELNILRFVLSEYGNLGYEKLTEISYNTEPMKNAKRGEILDFNYINKSIKNKIAKVKKEIGSLDNYLEEPPKFEDNDELLDYQYKVMSD